jgi:hypothetical protein
MREAGAPSYHRRMKLRGGLVGTLLALIALTVAAAPATAASTRAEYAAQANQICKLANTQIEQAALEARAKLKRLARKEKKSKGGSSIIAFSGKAKRKKSGRGVLDAFDRIFNALYEQAEQIARAELAQLELLAAAPGDESLVAAWVANRRLMLDLSEMLSEVDRRQARVFSKLDAGGRGFSPKKFFQRIKRLNRRIERLEQQAESIYQQLEAAAKVDLEYGTQLGAAYCVTEATGTSQGFSGRGGSAL